MSTYHDKCRTSTKDECVMNERTMLRNEPVIDTRDEETREFRPYDPKPQETTWPKSDVPPRMSCIRCHSHGPFWVQATLWGLVEYDPVFGGSVAFFDKVTGKETTSTKAAYYREHAIVRCCTCRTAGDVDTFAEQYKRDVGM